MHRHFYTNALTQRTYAHTHTWICTKKPLHRTEQFLHIGFLTRRSFYTEQFFTQRSFYTEQFFTQHSCNTQRPSERPLHRNALTLLHRKFFHTDAVTRRSLCTRRKVCTHARPQKKASTARPFHRAAVTTNAFTDGGPYTHTQKFLYTNALIWSSFYAFTQE